MVNPGKSAQHRNQGYPTLKKHRKEKSRNGGKSANIKLL